MATCVNGERLRIKDLENIQLVREPSFRVMRDREIVLRYRKYYDGTDKEVGFVGGVYDRLGEGHARYLLKCLAECDILIVALDSDKLARKRKNDPLRPWDSEEKRSSIISLGGFGHIITFRTAEEHPYDLIRLLQPDVLFTSRTTTDVTDEDREKLRECCGRVVVFDPQSAEHTTDEFFRMEKFHTIKSAKKIVDAVDDMVKPFGKRAVLEDVEDNEGAKQ